MRLRVAKRVSLARQCRPGPASAGNGCHRVATFLEADRKLVRAMRRSSRLLPGSLPQWLRELATDILGSVDKP